MASRPRRRSARKERGSLWAVRESFRHCYGQRCHPNARFHAVDIRLDVVSEQYQAAPLQIVRAQTMVEARKVFRELVDALLDGKGGSVFDHTRYHKLRKQLHTLAQEDRALWRKLVDWMLEHAGPGNNTWTDDPFLLWAVLQAALMDAYFLARMFKQSLQTRVVVAYVGEAHATNIRRFFNEALQAETLLELGNTNGQCLHVDDWSAVWEAFPA